MTRPRSRSILGRVVVTLLIAQLLAVLISLALIAALFDPPRGGLFRVVALVGSVSLVATIGAGVILVSSARREVSRLARDAASVAGGDFGHPVARPGASELAPIADSLDSMARHLQDRVDRLQRLESLRSDFAANVSHELRTPITNIKGYIETLLEFGFDDRDEARRYLDIIRTNSSRLAAIVEDIMALSKFESDLDESLEELTSILLSDLFADVGRQHEREAVAREIRVVVAPSGRLSIRGRRQLLEQAVSNLVSNAIRYSHPGTDVTLRAETDDGRISIEVADEGPGIEPEHLPRLFERFYRVDKARSRAVGGTGLGLAIVKHIALKHGGNVEVLSEPGKGSVFRINLPAADVSPGAGD